MNHSVLFAAKLIEERITRHDFYLASLYVVCTSFLDIRHRIAVEVHAGIGRSQNIVLKLACFLIRHSCCYRRSIDYFLNIHHFPYSKFNGEVICHPLTINRCTNDNRIISRFCRCYIHYVPAVINIIAVGQSAIIERTGGHFRIQYRYFERHTNVPCRCIFVQGMRHDFVGLVFLQMHFVCSIGAVIIIVCTFFIRKRRVSAAQCCRIELTQFYRRSSFSRCTPVCFCTKRYKSGRRSRREATQQEVVRNTGLQCYIFDIVISSTELRSYLTAEQAVLIDVKE